MDRALTNGAGLAELGRAGDAKEIRLESISLVVENMQCGSCMGRIERALMGTKGVAQARAILSVKRVSVMFDAHATDAEALVGALERAGFRAAEMAGSRDDTNTARADDLLRRLGVAGFAAANVMLLSVSVWAGTASDMDQTAADLFHWLSALIAMPAVAYSGQPFFQSAIAALKARRLNMDVPISLGILLATSMSLFQTMRGSEQVYFDAAITLTFFLLIGRFLDEQVRVRARGAAENLLGLKSQFATVVDAEGVARRVPARALLPGMRIQVAAGERIAVDGRIITGSTEVDTSLITGESVPRPANISDLVHAGTVNLVGSITLEATATDDHTVLAEMTRLVRAAEQGRGQYVRLADRAARLYAPAVHLLGAATLAGWLFGGAPFEQALTYAIAVLIITCPCALALAVPAVQVAATSRLFRGGIIVKAADGLERIAEADTIVFDKTGTLTRGEPSLTNSGEIDDATLTNAVALAVTSRHPYSRALVRAAQERGIAVSAAMGAAEQRGLGLSAPGPSGQRRLGSAAWVKGACADAEGASLWYADGSGPATGFRFEDTIRSDAPKVVNVLRHAGYKVCLLSGDREAVVRAAAQHAGIDDWQAEVRPEGKLAKLDEFKRAGRKVLMVGDGLNDAPALAAAHASLSPSTAADVSQSASDAVFQGERLAPVLELLGVARTSQRMALQNFAIALGYNAVSVPLAMAGYVTPLIAALAMSLSSIAVTANALRLGRATIKLGSVGR